MPDMSEHIQNAVITEAEFSTEKGGLSIWVTVSAASGAQGFGGYQLVPDDARANYCGLFIRRLFQVAGVSRWADLPGKAVRVAGDTGRIRALGHIVREDWFDPRAEFAALVAGEGR